MRNKRKLIHGVAYNDADYRIVIKKGPKGCQVTLWRCPIYSVLVDMIKRCYSSNHLAACPWYEGCSVCDEWLTFSNFRRWMIQQDWEGKELDKDLLVDGNKLYSPETCIFVDGVINGFLVNRKNHRGDYPLGSHLHRDTGKLCVQCKNPFTGKKKYLGLYENPEDAYEAWRSFKHEIACKLSEAQTDQRIITALRTRFLK